MRRRLKRVVVFVCRGRLAEGYVWSHPTRAADSSGRGPELPRARGRL